MERTEQTTGHSPNRQVVWGVIPNAKDPTLRVVDAAGRYPIEDGPIGTSPEALLNRIGANVVGRAISVDFQAERGNHETHSGTHNLAIMHAKPVSDAELAEGYRWERSEEAS